MPREASQAVKRGRPAKSQSSTAATKRKAPQQAGKKKTGPAPNAGDSDNDAPGRRAADDDVDVQDREDDEDEEEGPEHTIPPELLTRLLHEFFEKDDTRLSKDANAAAGKYMDVFVREAIARCVQERPGGFLEVEDLEKIAPQLLMDF
ncbi:Centromere protein X [Colletotrichum sidae]|uniref:Centromere protein X n=1 Tax=Colletotrichum sidae TaxID=1347389 RepID=A0A4R8TQY0_9PEZI|nr:Centromere protein X [Colletotrichum sidae]